MTWPEAGKPGVFVQIPVFVDAGCRYVGFATVRTPDGREDERGE